MFKVITRGQGVRVVCAQNPFTVGQGLLVTELLRDRGRTDPVGQPGTCRQV
jgi:hypothetical protein